MLSFFINAQKKEIFRDTIAPSIPLSNSIGFNHSTDLPLGLSPRHLSSLSYGKKTKYGSVIATLQHADRFSKKDNGLDIEMYPKIIKGTYAYLGFGTGFQKELFPKSRLGAEVFQSLPKSFEASLGLRYLRFNNSEVTVYTGSVGKYYKNYWFLFRTYFTPKSEGNSASYNILARKYFRDADHYLTASLGYGSGFAEVGFNEYFSRKSFRASLDWQQSLFDNFFINPQIDYRADEKTFAEGNYQNTIILSLSAKLKF